MSNSSRSVLRFLPAVVRVLMGLAFTFFGLNGFLQFLPPPESPMPEEAMAFIGTLMATGYMFQLIAATQLISGLFLLANRFVPLALLLLAPFLVNSIAFHVFLEPQGIVIALVFTAAELYLAWVHRVAFRPLFVARA